jgi:hypothetical protein
MITRVIWGRQLIHDKGDKMKIKQQLINGATLLGTALTLFGLSLSLTSFWQKNIVFGSGAIFMALSLFAFVEKEK